MTTSKGTKPTARATAASFFFHLSAVDIAVPSTAPISVVDGTVADDAAVVKGPTLQCS